MKNPDLREGAEFSHDVLARLDEWLVGADDTRWVFVTGGLGMGADELYDGRYPFRT